MDSDLQQFQSIAKPPLSRCIQFLKDGLHIDCIFLYGLNHGYGIPSIPG